MIRALADRVEALGRGGRAALAPALGATAAAALPPYHLVFLLFPALMGLVWLIKAAPTVRAAFLSGWLFGIGFFGAGLYWVVLSFYVDAERFGWMAPFALVGLACGLALFIALVAALTRASGARDAARVLVLAVLWVFFEWVRGWILTGFPWNLIGSVWTFSPTMIQGVALFGVYGLSLLTMIAFAMPAIVGEGGPRRGRIRVACALSILPILAIGGIVRLDGAGAETVEGVRLRLVQAAIPQTEKWKRELRKGHVIRQMRLSVAPDEDGTASPPDLRPTHVIWPETAVPYFLSGDPDLVAMLATVVPEGGLLITGAPRLSDPQSADERVWNSIHAIDETGAIRATYDKARLVPFGEYVPFRGLLDIAKLTVGARDFSPGPGVVTLALPGLPPASPLVCYEVIFPGRVVARDALGDATPPEWLLNLTNDAWFGTSSGPYQHLATARLRAVEEGLPVVRAANTGISAIIDPYGRTVVSLGLDLSGVIDGPLPAALKEPPPYARMGDWTWGGAALLLLLGSVVAGRGKSQDFQEELNARAATDD